MGHKVCEVCKVCKARRGNESCRRCLTKCFECKYDTVFDKDSTAELKMGGHEINMENGIIDNLGDPRPNSSPTVPLFYLTTNYFSNSETRTHTGGDLDMQDC